MAFQMLFNRSSSVLSFLPSVLSVVNPILSSERLS